MLEVWRPVVGYEGLYLVSDQGQVRSLPRPTTPGGLLKLNPEHDGRFYVHLSRLGKVKRWRVARLVTEAFIGPRPEGLQVLHKNDVNTDDRLVNLYYGTWADNCADMVKNGSQKGLKNPGVKLAESQVMEIRKRAETGESQRKIAAEFGVGQATVSRIKLGENWGWLK